MKFTRWSKDVLSIKWLKTSARGRLPREMLQMKSIEVWRWKLKNLELRCSTKMTEVQQSSYFIRAIFHKICLNPSVLLTPHSRAPSQHTLLKTIGLLIKIAAERTITPKSGQRVASITGRNRKTSRWSMIKEYRGTLWVMGFQTRILSKRPCSTIATLHRWSILNTKRRATTLLGSKLKKSIRLMQDWMSGNHLERMTATLRATLIPKIWMALHWRHRMTESNSTRSSTERNTLLKETKRVSLRRRMSLWCQAYLMAKIIEADRTTSVSIRRIKSHNLIRLPSRRTHRGSTRARKSGYLSRSSTRAALSVGQ